MVNFGQQLLESQYGPWTPHYIDYEHLKHVLDDECTESHQDPPDQEQQKQQVVNSDFLSLLYTETEKVSFFVLQELGRITLELATCRQELKQGMDIVISNDDDDDEEDPTHHQQTSILLVGLETKYVKTGETILRLIRFVNLNVTGFRKILKKHDKVTRMNLSLSYLTLTGTAGMGGTSGTLRFRRFIGEDLNFVDMGNQLMQPLLQDDTITAVIVAFEAGIEELKRLQLLQYQIMQQSMSSFTKMNQKSRSNTLPNLQQLMMEDDNDDKYSNKNNHHPTKMPTESRHEGNSERTPTITSTTPTNRSHDDLQSIEQSGSFSPRKHNNKKTSPGQVLLQIHAARGRLHQTNEFIKLLAIPMMTTIAEDDDSMAKGSISGGTTTTQNHHHRPSRFSNTLNLLSTFFYMTNYYIVAPTSATYADKVGSDSSVASIIIGMTAFAALGSTILYSYWTSYSYKSALIFASTCSAIGNLLYASGLPFHSLNLVMLGRLMNGFGSARSINRRYIADSYSYSERTTASAAFVTASALGMATGPALASILHLATEDSDSVYWQAENAPGWFMFTVWVVFLICLIWKFEDPPRHQSAKVDATTITATKTSQNGTSDEKTALLGNGEDDGEDNESVPLCCNIPVIITLMVYMVLKMVLEAVLSSESNLTALYFGWDGNIMGLHLTLLALLILPVNFGVAFLARSYFDRELIIGLLVAMLGGCTIIYQYQDDIEDYTLSQYLIGSAVLFVCASALEAPNMSLLSKVIPRKWSKGIINVGLLATESGTLGRVIGDALLAAIASRGLDQMLNSAFGAFGGIILGVIFLCVVSYRHLEPKEKDE